MTRIASGPNVLAKRIPTLSMKRRGGLRHRLTNYPPYALMPLMSIAGGI